MNKSVVTAHQVCFTSLRVAVVVARRHSTSRPCCSTSVSIRCRSTSVCLFLNWIFDEVEDELGFGDWRWMVVWLWVDDEDDDSDGG
ncbi:hypothetical protein QYF36_014582 [Acer negundo]|nr:hypothetical protein QYF36_014582 [Acer negundo]